MMFPADFLDAMRARLVAQRNALRADLVASEASTDVVELDQSKVGRLSRMDALQVQAMAKANAQRRHVLLRDIGAALRRLDAGEYGYCEVCGEPIDTKRLEINPSATMCIGCAARDEH